MEINEKKQEILKAAAECYARYGYEKTTMDDIGKPVGLNKVINEILEYCMKQGEIISCDTKLIAKSILTVADAIKIKAFQNTEYNFSNKFDYSKIEDEVKFTIALILNGIRKV